MDLSQVQTDSGDSDLSALESDGTQLFKDATMAFQDRPSASIGKTPAFNYGIWMGYVTVGVRNCRKRTSRVRPVLSRVLHSLSGQ